MRVKNGVPGGRAGVTTLKSSQELVAPRLFASPLYTAFHPKVPVWLKETDLELAATPFVTWMIETGFDVPVQPPVPPPAPFVNRLYVTVPAALDPLLVDSVAESNALL